MKAALEQIQQSAFAALDAAADLKEIDDVRVKYLGKKGELTGILKMRGKLSAEERPVMGQLANQIRAVIEAKIEEAKSQMEQKLLNARLIEETLDVTMPGKKTAIGKKHPLSLVLDEIKDIFIGMGFHIATGPEVERD